MTDIEIGEYRVEGKTKLSGSVTVSGAKNAVLPIMSASLLSDDETTLKNVPSVGDVFTLKTILEKEGIKLIHSDSTMHIKPSGIHNSEMPEESRTMRASILVTGPLLARFGEITIVHPGGCAIGKRPIDLHLKGFQALGFKLERISTDRVKISEDSPKGATVKFPFPSVGATENIMSAAVLIDGKTIIENAAREPEIVDLARFLTSMGAKILGAGSHRIEIEGVEELHGTLHNVIPDRIEAATYLMAAAITEGEAEIRNVSTSCLAEPIEIMTKVGLDLDVNEDSGTVFISSKAKSELNPMRVITAPYPGFPTDLQPLLLPLCSLVKGNSTITETIFKERFRHVKELNKMGADIRVRRNMAFVKGVSNLHMASVSATDLRAGAALILAGLAAEGTTTISNAHHIDRGYEEIGKKLRKMGANIERTATMTVSVPEEIIQAS